MKLIDGRLVAAAILLAIVCAPTDWLKSLVSLDDLIFRGIILLFLVVSAVGTRIVLRCGDLPANDELFNLSELTPTQSAALRGEHARAPAG